MRSKFYAVISVVVVLTMLAVACGPAADTTAGAAGAGSKDPTTWVETSIGDPETLDPSLTYETGGGEINQNVLDNLVFFKKDAGAEFVPWIATEVPTLDNGGISADGKTVTFKIREGVKFHDGSPMTVNDVAFTFWRNLLAGGTNSPQWMMMEPVYGAGLADIAEIVDAASKGTDLTDPAAILETSGDALYDDRAAMAETYDAAVLQAVCEDLKARVVPDEAAGTVTFTLAQPWAPFLGTLAGGGWGGIQSQAWVGANGGWDGDCASWTPYYGWLSEEFNETPLGVSAMGTGPYKFVSWTQGEEIVLEANEDFWMTEPAWEGAPVGAPRIKNVIIKIVEEFSTRLAMAQAGDADDVQAGSTEDWPILDELVGKEISYTDYLAGGEFTATNEGQPFRKITDILVVNNRTDVGFQFDINTEGGNNFMGSGKLDGDGIPATFFQDPAIRRAMNYCFNFDLYFEDVLLGEGQRAPTLMLPGQPGYDENAEQYTYDPEKCAEEFEKSYWTTCTETDTAADDAAVAATAATAAVAAYVEPTEAAADAEAAAEGEEAVVPATLEELEAAAAAAATAAADAKVAADACEAQPVSEVGFRFSAIYNAGNTQRQTIAELMQTGLQEAGEQYQVETVGLPWPTYLRQNRAGKLPVFIIGWIGDYYDTHNWTYTFTAGYYAFRQNFPAEDKAKFVDLCTQGVVISDPVERDTFYKEVFNPAYHEFAPALLLFHPTQRSYQPQYVEGWYASPMYSNKWYYSLAKN
jgi:peptide/nickel transport system substrate-binding protein